SRWTWWLGPGYLALMLAERSAPAAAVRSGRVAMAIWLVGSRVAIFHWAVEEQSQEDRSTYLGGLVPLVRFLRE
ncbi:MAG TPA: hypothetical protein VMX14_02370, partial [Anaerolineae bacterium]|nr:hypothetical protein [Anaerolineae bacterium]